MPSEAPARLFLRLFDEETGQPVASDVQLWRLGVAADAEWTEGDWLQESVPVPAEGTVVERLPRGRYRLFAAVQPAGSEDPGTFEVEGPETTVRLPVRLPGSFRVRLLVLDEFGRSVTSGCETGGGSSTCQEGFLPDWARPRKRRDGAPPGEASFLRCSWSVGCGGRQPIDAGADGCFDLGPLDVDGRDTVTTVWREFAFEGRTSVRVEVEASDGPADRFLVGVSLPEEFVHRFVLLPDGRRAADAGARVEGCSCAGPEPPRAIRVSARLAGYEDLRADLDPLHPAPITMEPRRHGADG